MSERTPSELRQAAAAFLADDPDPETRVELAALLASDDLTALAERFSGPLEFGTAGLRGLLGAGESRMNRRVVAQTTAGLCAYLAQTTPKAKERGLCVGYDGRHMSRQLAEETCRVAAGAGFVVHAFDAVVPTPLLAFAVLDRAAAAGVMVTASHNPKQYNGYKVYWGNGAQIIPPHDLGIAQAIERVSCVLSLPRDDGMQASGHGLRRSMRGVQERYLAGVHALVGVEPGGSPLRIAYTALHGVGEPLARATLAQAGFTDVHSVQLQSQPDPEFPTVAFPNPEEQGAMDRVLELAGQCGAELIIANDPDADRLALGCRTRSGELVTLSGNEVGVLLADHLLTHAPADGKNLVLSSIVSTPLVARVAAAHGAHWEPTLTGFKWIANRALELERSRQLRFVLGFEEALGYTIGTLVRDKDGLSAAALAARTASAHKRAGRTLIDALDELYRRHGLFGSYPRSITLPGAQGVSKIRTVMQRLRAQPPTRIGPSAVLSTLDLEQGVLRRGSHTEPSALPKSDVLVLELEGGHRIAIRPSGTEPKLKIYLDTCTQVATAESLEQARTRLSRLADGLRDDFLAQAGLA
ncbi:MAG TPA: phospho-sugar mutase [Polyangiales bacterium]